MSEALQKAPVHEYHRNWSQPINLRPGGMARLKKSYKRFLYMTAKYPLKDGNNFVLPIYAMDIIWHSHMQEPLKYAADCVRFVGYIIEHDP